MAMLLRDADPMLTIGRLCQYEILDFVHVGDWNNLAERMRTRIDETVKFRIK